MAQSAWLAYEAAARKVLTDMREVLGISVVEGKQSVPGKNSPGWELDAKAWLENSTGFLVIEARRHTTSRLSQEAVAAIAYRMSDVGAAGGIVLTPLPLQRGAKAIAAKEAIAHVQLSPDSTAEAYLAEFLGRRFIGVSAVDSVHASESATYEVVRAKPRR